VSLILEALKKLERDKKVEDRGGFLVMAAQPWPSPGDGRRTLAWVAIGGVVMMALGAGLALSFWRGSTSPTAAAHGPTAPAASASRAPVLPQPMAPLRLPPPSSRVATAPKPAGSSAAKPAVAAENAPKEAPRTSKETAVAPVPADADVAAEPVKAAASAPAPRFRLTAISERDGKPVAVINDRMVFEGDSFEDITVLRIGDAEVELKVAGKSVTVPFQF
jgi:hypothetical protein